MRLTCPYCGERDIREFTYLGDAALCERPDDPTDLAAFHDYVHLRDNPAGPHRELWQHSAGCRAWLVVTRETVSHRVFSVTPAREEGA